MLSKVADFIAKHQLLSPSGLHLIALSGGADSVALLRILRDLGYLIEAAHCNFHLRGAESDRDEQFVKDLCNLLNVPLHLIHFDTAEYASLHQVSIEMAARELRYGYFRQLCQDIGAETVCVAHHRDDAVETFLMNLLRGSGIHGLTGIRPQNGLIVRPLLGVSRQDILEYLHSIGQNYVTDSTNLHDDVLRNKLRLNVLPLLKDINPSAAENIDKTARFLQETEKIFNSFMQTALQRLVRTEGLTLSVCISELLQQPAPATFLHEWLSSYGFNTAQTQQIIESLNGHSGKTISSVSHTLLIDREMLFLEPVTDPSKPIRMPEPGRYRFSPEILFEAKLSDDITILKSDDCVSLDAVNIQFPLTVRFVQSGDAFCPLGMEGHKLVSDFLTDRKLTLLEKRRQLVVTAANGDILWLVGQRPDNRYRITPQTTQILIIKKVDSSSSGI